MKIFNKEGEYECVYVQQSDLKFMPEHEFNIPDALAYKIKHLDFDNEYNRFYKFYQPEIINYIKQIDWIYDLSKINKLSKENRDMDLEYYIETARLIEDTILNGSNDLGDFASLLLDYEKIIYLISSICKYAYQSEVISGDIIYPNAVNEYGFVYETENLEFRQKLNPDFLSVKRKNKSNISEKELLKGLDVFREYRLNEDETFNRLLMDYEMSDFLNNEEIEVAFREIYPSNCQIIGDYIKGIVKTKKVNRRISH